MFPVAFWSWGICSPSKQFSMYCGSRVLREVQLKVIETEISGPSKENHYQGSSQGSRQNKHLAERQEISGAKFGAWAEQLSGWLRWCWSHWPVPQGCKGQWPPCTVRTPHLCDKSCKYHTQHWHIWGTAAVLNWVPLSPCWASWATLGTAKVCPQCTCPCDLGWI